MRKSIKYQKGSLEIIIGAILFLFLVGGGMYYLGTRKSSSTPQVPSSIQPTRVPTPSSSWKTYINQDLGFSVDYPKDWITKEFSRDFALMGKSKGVAFRPIDPEIVNDWGLITVGVEDNPKNLTTDSFINNYLCDSPGVCASAKKAIPITVSGVKGKKVINPPAPVPSQIVVLLTGNKVFTLNVVFDKSLEKLYSIQQKEQIFSQFLSTFKFIY